MKTIFLGLILISCFYQKQKDNSDPILKITVLKVPFNINTPVRVTCDEFEKAMDLDIDTIILTKNTEFVKIVKKMRQMKPGKLENQIDTRAKIFVQYKSGQIDTICIEQSPLFYRNGLIYDFKTDELYKFVDDLPYNYNR